MKRPYLNQFERSLIINNETIYGAGLAFHLARKKLLREIERSEIGSFSHKIVAWLDAKL